MSKKLILALLVFVIVLCAFLYVKSVLTSSSTLQKYSLLRRANSPTPSLHIASLSLLPNPPIVLSGQSGTLDIALETNTTPNLIQVELAFDPGAVSILDIIPADYFRDPSVILKKIDAKNGRISYAIRGQLTNKSSKTLATIEFTTFSVSKLLEAKFTFLPKTSVKSGGEDVPLKVLNTSSVMLKPSFTLPSSSSAQITP